MMLVMSRYLRKGEIGQRTHTPGLAGCCIISRGAIRAYSPAFTVPSRYGDACSARNCVRRWRAAERVIIYPKGLIGSHPRGALCIYLTYSTPASNVINHYVRHTNNSSSTYGLFSSRLKRQPASQPAGFVAPLQTRLTFLPCISVGIRRRPPVSVVRTTGHLGGLYSLRHPALETDKVLQYLTFHRNFL